MTVESIAERQSSRNELLTTLLARTPMNVNAPGSRRGFIMDRRGDGVPVIITESEELSGRRPGYRLIDDAELLLTIFAAPEPGVRTEGVSPRGELGASDYGRSPAGGGRGEVFRIAGDDSGAIE